MKNKLVKENIGDILKPKGSKDILNDLIEKGSINDKYALVVAIFKENYDEIYKEFNDRGIDNEDLIQAFINYYESNTNYAEKINWILSDILKDSDITDEILKKAIV
jgi:hypothetical protein